MKLTAVAILLIVTSCASWYERPLIMADVEDELYNLLSAKILSVAVLESFCILVAKFTACVCQIVCC
jgi:hypothetical protein